MTVGTQIIMKGAQKAVPVVATAAAAAFTASEVAGLMVVGTMCALPIMAGFGVLMWVRYKTNSTVDVKIKTDGVEFNLGGA